MRVMTDATISLFLQTPPQVNQYSPCTRGDRGHKAGNCQRDLARLGEVSYLSYIRRVAF